MAARRLGPRLALVGAVVVAGCGGGEQQSAAPTRVPAEEILKGGPYLGVACPTPNAVACDRIGLHVRLREPAASVSAELGGKRFELDDPGWNGPVKDGGRLVFAGFLQPAGLREPGPLHVVEGVGANSRWIGEGAPVRARVRLRIDRLDGSEEVTFAAVGLSAGWG